MNSIYILIVIFQVYGGNNMHTQEFTGISTCEIAKAKVLKSDRKTFFLKANIWAKCVKK